MQIPDHPIITNMERTGWPDGKEPEYPHCPVCGGECHTIYKDKDDCVVGCDSCIKPIDAWEYQSENN